MVMYTEEDALLDAELMLLEHGETYSYSNSNSNSNSRYKEDKDHVEANDDYEDNPYKLSGRIHAPVKG